MKTKDKMINDPGWAGWIGKKIQKHSSRPFKNGMIVSHPVSITTNPNTDKIAFEMFDGSIVDCYQCKLLDQSGS